MNPRSEVSTNRLDFFFLPFLPAVDSSSLELEDVDAAEEPGPELLVVSLSLPVDLLMEGVIAGAGPHICS